MLATLLKPLLKLVINLLFRVRIDAPESAFRHPRTLIVANHESFLDGLVLGLNLPVRATFVINTQIAAQPLMKRMLAFIDYLAVDPANPMAMKQVVRLLESGTPVVIFPEGRLTVTGSLMKVYDGAGFAAAKTGAAVVPVRLSGPAKTFFSRLAGIYPRRLFPRISLQTLPARHIAAASSGPARERRRQAGEAMRRILTDMIVKTTPPNTLYGAFLDARDVFGSGFGVVEDVRFVEETYGSLLKTTLAIQRMLAPRTQPGEVVGVLMPNAAPTLAMVLALTALRRVPGMLNYTAGRDGLQAACVAARITQIYASRAFLEKGKLTQIVEGLDGIAVHYVEDLKASFGLADKLAVLFRLPFARGAQLPAAPGDPAVVLFTSGSEGKPKGVVHTHGSILANVAQVRAVADFMPHDKFMVALPLFHSFGFTCGAILPLVSGSRAFLYPSPLHYRVIPEVVYDRNCTVLFGTSTFLGNYARFAHPYDFGRLRYVVAGAEKLSDAVRETWADKFGLRILEGYGVTECAPVISVNVPMAARRGTVGQPLPGIETRLDPVPGIARGGVLSVRGPNVMAGYLRYENPGVLEAPSTDAGPGWYSTGDIVDIDADGFIHILGRVKRFAKIAGEMVSLEAVEKLAIAAGAPASLHAASTRSDAGKGEALVLFTTDAALTRDALLAAARAAGAPELAVPRDIRRVDAIPLLGSGKTDYVTLKKLAEAPAPRAAAQPVPEANA
ncbi:bifunctional acyl-ACP--phospholipid O-acyltransferase/long-chain-fatty-acid--ACP ligase [Derxia lacustris]|uniref:bifunctional acyl-ACP--phospholipid O-acyltransferase/long-chain-fatty-acid--ACP ligase n=1 Tax=Derxia lacustris TaxID=764842 RepID=UPI000A1726C1|nr:bifunctional acyl-ACP--phospholipid O-acyltransferase/long-chain-fatty-acid--ACP ligase [Derxia lacustris]